MHGFSEIRLPKRSEKPRETGMTMVLDKNLGVNSLSDLTETAGAYIDVVKFGWGTSRVYSEAILRKKLQLLSDMQIKSCPGGTLGELAIVQNKVDYFLNQARELGFTCVEVSNGTIELSRADKNAFIRKAKDLGFTVFSEIGRKFEIEERNYHIDQRTEDALSELDAGADKIVCEARESGSFGIFDKNGQVIPEVVEKFVARLGIVNVIFEAPLPAQQKWLVSNLGTSVNLGNVAPEHAINLETLRCGLRAGTLKEFHLNEPSVFIENAVPGSLNAASRQDVVVMVDALRASSTIVTALANGVTRVRPVSSVDECVGELTAGERGGAKIPTLDLDNSPTNFLEGKYAGKELFLTTTNGTECINAAAKGSAAVLVGSLLNAKSVAKTALALAESGNHNISIVIAGRNNLIASEDLIGASEIIKNLKGCSIKGYIKPLYSSDFVRDFENSDSGKNLVSLGKRDDVEFCARANVYDSVPILKDGFIVEHNAETSVND